jgi:hypothetical protein
MLMALGLAVFVALAAASAGGVVAFLLAVFGAFSRRWRPYGLMALASGFVGSVLGLSMLWAIRRLFEVETLAIEFLALVAGATFGAGAVLGAAALFLLRWWRSTKPLMSRRRADA